MSRGREQIIGAAIHHLNQHPTASMAQLAEAAGVSRATLHRHFTSREDLVIALGRRALERWAEVQEAVGLTEATASADPARIAATLREMLTGLVDTADEHGFALTDHAMAVHPELLRRSDELEEREVAFFEAAQRAGVLRADQPARWVSNTVYGLLIAVRESLRSGDVARRDVPRLLADTFLHGTTPQDTP
ncbi:TetR/AcrR family transcriptional regulator [Nonomuraea sp. NPDC046570]|uniref:TetR/AcrR family transcriptional regulator n=1 Tax=Nonomuraea sp. NPDC046570 TaxID=3155255 RepID=UPI0033FE44AF